MEGNFKYKDCEIQKIVDNIASSMQGRCYLEHQSRAIELMFDEKRKSQFRSFNSKFDSMSVDIQKSEEDKRDELAKLASNKFHIYKRAKAPKDNKYFGYGTYYKNGYDITYASNDKTEAVCERIIIAHELGHLILHYFADPTFITDQKKDTRGLKDTDLEKEADYFAYCIIKNRSDFYSDADGTMKKTYVFDDNEIKQKFHSVKTGIKD